MTPICLASLITAIFGGSLIGYAFAWHRLNGRLRRQRREFDFRLSNYARRKTDELNNVQADRDRLYELLCERTQQLRRTMTVAEKRSDQLRYFFRKRR